MPSRKGHIRGHSRISKNGKTHNVKAHSREITWKDLVADAVNHGRGKGKKIGSAAVGSAAVAAISYTLYGVLSLSAAIMCAIGLVSMATIGMMVGNRKRRRKSWLKRHFGGALSPKRRAKLWWTQARVVKWKRLRTRKI